MTKKILSLLLAIVTAFTLLGQVFNPVKRLSLPLPEVVSWSASYKMHTAKTGIATIKVHISKGWHIYGTELAKKGPVATEFTFSDLNNVKLVGKTSSSKKAKRHFDSTFNMTVSWWEGDVTFTQKFSVIDSTKPYSFGGSVRYMSCNEEQQKCNPPKKFEFKFKH